MQNSAFPLVMPYIEAAACDRFQALVENCCDAIEILDAGGAVVYASPTAGRITGYNPQELLGRNAFDVVAASDRDVVRAKFAECLNGPPGHAVAAEFQVVCRNGEIADFEATATNQLNNPSIGGVVVNYREITPDKRAAAELAASERHFRAIFDSALDAVWIADDSGHCLDANSAACELFGTARERMIGHSISEFVAVDSDSRTSQPDFLTKTQKRGEFRALRPDGRELTVEYSAVFDFVPGRHLATLRDVTATRTVQEHLRNASKLEAVGRLAGGIAHEFNNMLMVITSYAALLARNSIPECDEKVEAILRAASRASSLTQQLLAFSRKQVLAPELLHVEDVLAAAAPLVKRLVGEDVRLLFQTEPDIRTVVADRAQLEQVIVNLAVNSRDAMPGGGVLSISTSNRFLTASDRLPGNPAPGLYVLIEVTDTGTGIPANVTPHIFEPFFTTKPRGQGTGLGLSTVYGIVKQSNGFVYVSSRPGEGTTFRIYLPAAEDPRR